MKYLFNTKPGWPWRTSLVGASVILVLPWLFALLDETFGGVSWALTQLVVVNPVLFIVGSVRSSIRYEWKVVIPVGAYSAAFLVIVFTLYNTSALVYLVAYIGLALISIFIVRMFERRNLKNCEHNK